LRYIYFKLQLYGCDVRAGWPVRKGDDWGIRTFLPITLENGGNNDTT
jgi:hypothetical protein